jgi:hypothetical protein
MNIEDYVARALRRRGVDLYRVLTWRARVARCRVYVLSWTIALVAVYLMRILYLSFPAWFGVVPPMLR